MPCRRWVLCASFLAQVGVGGNHISYSGLSYDSLLRQCCLPKQPSFAKMLTPPLMVLIVAAAAILTWGPKSANAKEDIGWNVLIPIALVAFQSCGQAVTSRALKYNALTSVVLTSLYCDLFSDAELFSLHNSDRNRRISAPVLLLLGAIAGGLVAHSPIGTAGALWIAAGLKLFVIVAWYLWPAVED
jgi:hypothetical protein